MRLWAEVALLCLGFGRFGGQGLQGLISSTTLAPKPPEPPPRPQKMTLNLRLFLDQAAIPGVCRGAQFLWLAGSASAGPEAQRTKALAL